MRSLDAVLLTRHGRRNQEACGSQCGELSYSERRGAAGACAAGRGASRLDSASVDRNDTPIALMHNSPLTSIKRAAQGWLNRNIAPTSERSMCSTPAKI